VRAQIADDIAVRQLPLVDDLDDPGVVRVLPDRAEVGTGRIHEVFSTLAKRWIPVDRESGDSTHNPGVGHSTTILRKPETGNRKPYL